MIHAISKYTSSSLKRFQTCAKTEQRFLCGFLNRLFLHTNNLHNAKRIYLTTQLNYLFHLTLQERLLIKGLHFIIK